MRLLTARHGQLTCALPDASGGSAPATAESGPEAAVSEPEPAEEPFPADLETATVGELTRLKDRIDALMREHDLTALLFPNSGSAVIGAKAGYPSVSVPAGYQAASRRPFNIAFLGQAWSEPTVIGYAYDFEQATELRRPPSAVNPSLFRFAAR